MVGTGSPRIGRMTVYSRRAPTAADTTTAPATAAQIGHGVAKGVSQPENATPGSAPAANTTAMYAESIAIWPCARFSTPVERNTIEIATAKAAYAEPLANESKTRCRNRVTAADCVTGGRVDPSPPAGAKMRPCRTDQPASLWALVTSPMSY